MTSPAENELDNLSRPMRDALAGWARERSTGSSGGWNPIRRRWGYSIRVDKVDISVEVFEDGSKAIAWTGPRSDKRFATTPLGLRRLLYRLLREKR